MPSGIRQNCNTCSYGVPHESFTGMNKCGRGWASDCIVYSATGKSTSERRNWKPSYKAMADSLEEFEKSQGIVNDFIKIEEMTI